MRKLFSLIAAVLFAGSMMASEAIMQYTGGSTTNMVGNGANNAATVGLDADLFTVLADKGANQNLPGLNKANDIRLYADKSTGNGNTITVSIASGTITSIVLDIKQNATFVVKAGETAVTEVDGAYAINATSFSIQNTTTGATTQLQLNKITITYTAEGGEPVVGPTVLQAVSDSTTWDFSKITANTANALYSNDGIKLTDDSEPSKNDEVIYADYSEDFMTIGEEFNKTAIAFKGEYPIRKNQYCQAGTLHFKADVPGTIVVKFSDTGSSASATAVKRYLVVNDEQTEYWTSRENNGETPYDAQLNVVSGKIAIPAGDVTITGSSAIVMYYVTFVPEKQDEPVVVPADTLTCAAAAELALAGNTEEKIIKGYVTEIVEAWSSYKNVSFWMADVADGGQVFEAFRVNCETEAEAPIVGDLVWVKGNLTAYTKNGVTIAETTKGGSFGIIEAVERPVVEPAQNLGEKTIAEFLALKNTKDTCILTGVVANVANNQYGNFDLVELGNAEVKVYVYGLLTAAGEAKKCYEEENIAEGDTLKVKAIYTTYNNNPQVKNAIFVEVKKAGSVTPGAEVEITIADGSFGDYVESYGYWMVEAQNTDYYISLSNYDLEITQAAGTYTAADLDPEYSYILTETDSINFVSGSIVLAVNAEGVATVTGSLVGNDGNTYILNIVCPAPDEHEYDDDSDFISNFSSYTIDTQYLSEYGDIYVEASDEAGYQIVLDLYVPTGASGLVAGTYEINSTYEAGTVAAGIYYGGIYPSYAGIATTEGLTNVWYLVSGTVVVDADLNITVNALNSLGHTINVTLKASGATGIEETLATGRAVKVLRNGQLLIMKGEKTFDVMGARIR